MTTIRNNPHYAKRNDPCPCGSGQKYKKCCSEQLPAPKPQRQVYIDSGEDAIRWVITDATGRAFFSDKDNRVLVFTDRAVAVALASLADFESQLPNEINIAGVGPSKFEHLKEIMPYVEISDIDTAAALVRERIAVKTAELQTNEGTTDGNQDQEAGAQSQEGDGNTGQEEAADQGPEAQT
jgi:hypothetical protein